jgi:hypothetical protein
MGLERKDKTADNRGVTLFMQLYCGHGYLGVERQTACAGEGLRQVGCV